MYKLIALDLDGTLLNSDHVITPKTKETIRKCIKDGIKVVLLSGREINSIKNYAKELGIKDYISAFNGGRITDALGKNVFFNNTIDENIIKRVIRLNKDSKIFTIIFSGDEIIVNNDGYWYKNFLKYTNSTPRIINDLYEYLEENHIWNNINKICFSDENEILEVFKKNLDKSLEGSLTTLYSLPIFLEVYSNGISKGLALEMIANKLNISPKEIIAFGDGENDISMIKYAGLGIAMANASKNLKSESDYITQSNDEEGVPQALEKKRGDGSLASKIYKW